MTTAAGFSLKRQLLLWLLLPQLILWLMGGVLAFRVAMTYAEKAIDQSLTQSVRSLARQVKPFGSGLLVDFPKAAQDILEQDPKDRVSYMVSSPPGSFLLGNSKLPGPPADATPTSSEPVLYNVELDGKTMRVATIDVSFGEGPTQQRMRVQVAKSLSVQESIARELVRDRRWLAALRAQLLVGLWHTADDARLDELPDVVANEVFLGVIEVPVDVPERGQVEDDRLHLTLGDFRIRTEREHPAMIH